MKFTETKINGLCIGDTCRGTVTHFTKNGTGIILENGEKAFAFGIQLAPNTPVFCTVIRHRTEWSDTKVSVDSYPFEAAAA